MGIANLPDEALRPLSAATTTGIYFGFAQVLPFAPPSDAKATEPGPDVAPSDRGVYPMAMSLGWNPFYKNERLSAVCQCHSTCYISRTVLMHIFSPVGGAYHARLCI